VAAIPNRYRLYIDESGDHTYNLLDQVSHRYLALMGVWFRQADDYVQFADGLEAFKREIFGPRPDRPVVLHRSDIINRRGPFGRLCNPDVQRRFDEGLLKLVREARYKMVVVVIDKKAHLEMYVSPFHPYHFCLAAMLDRYSGWLNYKNSVGDVMAESRGKEEDLQLKGAYRHVYENGTLMFSRNHHQRALTSGKIKIRPKRENIAGLQLADILAHPMKQAMLAEKKIVNVPSQSFGARLCLAAKPKLNFNELRGQARGYGLVWLSRKMKRPHAP